MKSTIKNFVLNNSVLKISHPKLKIY